MKYTLQATIFQGIHCRTLQRVHFRAFIAGHCREFISGHSRAFLSGHFKALNSGHRRTFISGHSRAFISGHSFQDIHCRALQGIRFSAVKGIACLLRCASIKSTPVKPFMGVACDGVCSSAAAGRPALAFIQHSVLKTSSGTRVRFLGPASLTR